MKMLNTWIKVNIQSDSEYSNTIMWCGVLTIQLYYKGQRTRILKITTATVIYLLMDIHIKRGKLLALDTKKE